MSEKFGDFFLAHFLGVTFAMKQDVTTDPIDICLLGTDRIMFTRKCQRTRSSSFGEDAIAAVVRGTCLIVPKSTRRGKQTIRAYFRDFSTSLDMTNGGKRRLDFTANETSSSDKGKARLMSSAARQSRPCFT